MCVQRISRMLSALLWMIALFLTFGAVQGGRIYAVMSGSMEPAIPTGALIVTVPVSASDLAVGDIITYAREGRLTVTHRIISVEADETDPGTFRFRTKGDANAHADAGAVHSRDVLGRVLVSLPAGGYIIRFLRKKPICYAMAGLAVLTMCCLLFPGERCMSKQRKQGKYLRSHGDRVV